MAELLLISDDTHRTARLARDLPNVERSTVFDLYDDASCPAAAELIVSDVKALTSEALSRLRTLLERVRGQDVPYVCLFHDNGARTRAYAELLGASSLLSAASGPAALGSALAELRNRIDPMSDAMRRHGERAERFLCTTFVPGRPLSPVEIAAGTTLIETALQEGGIRSWVRAVRRFDDATHRHCLLVAGLAAAFGGVLMLGAADRHHLVKAALLHDVGKIAIDAAILNKPGELDAVEMAEMRTHPAHGHAMLVGRGFDESLLAVAHSHHEMLDGSGYPDKLVGSQISDLVRLVTICDIFGALTEHRPYRARMESMPAYDILVGMAGRLDGDLVRAFKPVADAF
ncbi:HD domain-containing phosphohydrolase [Methylobacterium sp. WL120]|uniref:HD-GYP domain-containing protein n=1 Tax=Methylobacterium sp. WL120 TaxID=2603887 RepID=UPI0011CBCDC2|nr:HD domain-containing phosphohydrolase [Methylobacterium sp. WL120]TXM62203.1 HD domain-containing protein [Methylobacterium sp. WL120]